MYYVGLHGECMWRTMNFNYHMDSARCQIAQYKLPNHATLIVYHLENSLSYEIQLACLTHPKLYLTTALGHCSQLDIVLFTNYQNMFGPQF